jgi:hypothetical protein
MKTTTKTPTAKQIADQVAENLQDQNLQVEVKTLSKSDVAREMLKNDPSLTLKPINEELTKREMKTMYYSELLRVKNSLKK